jgi:hypothetical protein
MATEPDAIVCCNTVGSSGVKEPTDINALADEYLRLAYHGRALLSNRLMPTS